jgi:PAS domain S-box-containing protein
MKERNPLTILNLGRRTASSINDLERLLSLIPFPCLVADTRNLNILFCNPAAATLAGLPQKELVGSDLRSLFTDWIESPAPQVEFPTSRELHISIAGQAIQTIRLTSHALPDKKNQALFFIEPLIIPQVQPDLPPSGWELLLSNIQSLASAVEAPDRAAALSQATSAGQAITACDLFTIFLAGSSSPELIQVAAAGESTPFPASLPAQDLVHLSTAVVWNEGKRSHTTLHRAARKNGYPLVASSPLGKPGASIGLVAAAYLSPGKPENPLALIRLAAQLITSLIDIDTIKTELSNAATERLRLQAYDGAVEGAVREGLLVLSPDFQVLQINPAAEAIFGYRQQEAADNTVENILIGSEKITPSLQETRQVLLPARLDGLRLFRRYGESFLANVEIHPLSVAGVLDRILVIVQDLSESEQIREQARQLEQRALLGEFTAIFAHEVRNPINNISTGLELMALNLQGDDPQQELILRLQQDCDRLAELMKSVLSFARPLDYNLQPLQLPVLVQKLLDRLGPRLAKANVHPHLQVDGDIPPVLVDYRSLEQALNNIISNALQAMGENGGQLTFKIKALKRQKTRAQPEQPPEVEISIADTGPGIPKDLQDRIFQPFFTTSSSGTGLGLAITRRIINAHRGSIQVDSFPGGTVFTIRLPMAEPA